MLRRACTLLSLMLLSIAGFGQSVNEQRILDYIQQYKDLAMEEQRRVGIPAAITLAQGLLETNAGQSELAVNAKNHFGIKCKRDWTGDTYSYTDDAPNECFRKYADPVTSYRDHSDFLRKSKRYDSCFHQSLTDYAAWAVHLKKAGYATSNTYAARLIKIIETYHLQQYTYAAMEDAPVLAKAAEIAEPPAEVVPHNDAPPVQAATASAPDEPASGGEPAAGVPIDDPVSYTQGLILQKNGLRGFYARKGDALLEPAIRNNVRYAKLLEMNDLPDAPLESDMFVYLERKRDKGLRPTHTVAQGETMVQIAQAEGIRLAALRSLNLLEPNEEPLPGTVLYLQRPVAAKPTATRIISEERPSATPSVVAARQQADQSRDDAPMNAPLADDPETWKPTPSAPDTLVIIDPMTGDPALAGTVASAPINIANEPAVEEQDPEPVDQFTRLKARLDKSVYGTPQPAAPQTRPAVPGVTPPTATKAANSVAPASPAPATPPSPGTTQAQYHVVKSGDTAFAIAKKYGLTMKELQQLNNLDFSAIKVGQKLRVR